MPFLRSTLLAPLLLCGLAVCPAGAQSSDDSPPFFRARQQHTGYAGPGREDPPPDDVREVLIGYFGPGDPDDPVGGDMWRAAQLAIDQANRAGGCDGKPLRLVSAWSENPWGTGISGLVRLIYREHVWAVIGGIDGPSTHLAEQVVAKARLPLISPVATDKTVNLANVPWMFSLAPGDHLIAPPLAAEIARRLNGAPLVIISADDHDSQLLTVELKRALTGYPVAVRLHLMHRRGQAEVAEISRSAISAAPQGVAVIADAPDTARLVLRVRDDGYQGIVFGGPAVGQRRFRQLAGDRAAGVIFPQLFCPSGGAAQPPAPLDTVVASLRETSSSALLAEAAAIDSFDYTAAHAYDAVNLLVAAICRAGLNRARIGDALRESAPTVGLTGPICWDNLGSNTRPVAVSELGSVGAAADREGPTP